MEIVYFTLVAIVLYFLANRILLWIEDYLGRTLEQRTVVFFCSFAGHVARQFCGYPQPGRVTRTSISPDQPPIFVSLDFRQGPTLAAALTLTHRFTGSVGPMLARCGRRQEAWPINRINSRMHRATKRSP